MNENLINIAIKYLQYKQICSLSWLVYYCYYTNNDFNLSFEQIELMILLKCKEERELLLIENQDTIRFVKHNEYSRNS